MGIGPLDQGGATREPSTSKWTSHNSSHRWRKYSGYEFGTRSPTLAASVLTMVRSEEHSPSCESPRVSPFPASPNRRNLNPIMSPLARLLFLVPTSRCPF
jgi:hypothetical protein